MVQLVAHARAGVFGWGAPWMAAPFAGVAVLCWLLRRYGGAGDAAVFAGNGAVAMAVFFVATAGVDDANAAWLPVAWAAGIPMLAASCIMLIARRHSAGSNS